MVTLEALLVCDAAVRDERSGKWSLQGVFDAVWAERFPAVHAQMDVYFRLHFDDLGVARGGRPPHLGLTCRTAAGAVYEVPPLALRVTARGVAEGVVRINRLVLEKPGDYRFEVMVEGAQVGATTLTVGELPTAGEPRH